jgi:hypothetical protein
MSLPMRPGRQSDGESQRGEHPGPEYAEGGRVGGYRGKVAPLRRAARYQGFFPVGLEGPDQLAEIVPTLMAVRGEGGKDPLEPCDIVAELPPGTDPAPYASAGATWCLVAVPWDGLSVDLVRGVILDGPAPAT